MADEQEIIKEEAPKQEPVKEQPKAKKEEPAKGPTYTYCYLRSKANFTIPIKNNGQSMFIPPFGRVKVIKERLAFDNQFAKYLTLNKV